MFERRAYSLIQNIVKIRNLSTLNDILNLDLSKPLNLKTEHSIPSSFKQEDTKVTVLPNGFRVASLDSYGFQATIGVVVKAGPKYENKDCLGVSHFLEKLAFHSCSKFDDLNAYMNSKDIPCPTFDCQRARDFIIYAGFGLATNCSELVNILAETVMRPKLLNDELEIAKKAITNELLVQTLHPPVEPVINDLLLNTAYGKKNLGNSQFCAQENIENIATSDVKRFMSNYYRPERITLVGVGVSHEQLLSAAEENFFPWNTSYKINEHKIDDESNFQYIGGYNKLERDLSQYHAPMPEFAHCSIGFECPGVENEDDYVSVCLLTALLGGGGSFSAGGPGKGMYSRLYTHILNSFHWVNSCQALSHVFAGSSVLAINASSEPADLGRLVAVIINELKTVATTKLTDVEVNRAKSYLESTLLMNLEMKPVIFEDLARTLLIRDHRPPTEYWVEKIHKKTKEDLQELFSKMLNTNPTIVGFGKCENLPDFEDIKKILLEDPNGYRGKVSHLFRRLM